MREEERRERSSQKHGRGIGEEEKKQGGRDQDYNATDRMTE